uniref:Ig-like domain-containing protein n=1 Tax=Pelusios castaneus TaxID=367368 RepID=A0A8C8VHT3_9SAUR
MMLRKMAAATIFYLVLHLQAYKTTEMDSSQVNGMVYGTVYLNPQPPVLKTYNQITWQFNKTQKILTKERYKKVVFFNTSLENKLHYYENHTLEINQLQKQDSSTYLLVVEDSQGRESTSFIQLSVYEPVPKPSVNATNTNKKNGLCTATLECTVDATPVTYKWLKDGKDDVGENTGKLNVELKSDSNASYECIVSNPRKTQP